MQKRENQQCPVSDDVWDSIAGEEAVYVDATMSIDGLVPEALTRNTLKNGCKYLLC